MHANASRSTADAGAATYIIGQFWTNKDYSGEMLQYTASGTCDADLGVEWQDASLGSYWNDRFSSFKGYARCQIKVFENINFGGAGYGYASQANFAAGDVMNDATSSIKFR